MAVHDLDGAVDQHQWRVESIEQFPGDAEVHRLCPQALPDLRRFGHVDPDAVEHLALVGIEMWPADCTDAGHRDHRRHPPFSVRRKADGALLRHSGLLREQRQRYGRQLQRFARAAVQSHDQRQTSGPPYDAQPAHRLCGRLRGL